MPRLTNQQKSAARYAVLTQIAERFAEENEGFQYFLIKKGSSEAEPPTWRRLETFIKQMHEQGAKVRIVIESGRGN